MRRHNLASCGVLSAILVMVTLAAMPAAAQEEGRFQIEIWGGYASMNPSDFNLAVAHDDGVQELLFDDKYAWMMDTGQILSWEKVGIGERRELSHSSPVGARFKYSVNEWLAFSLGFTRFSTTESVFLPTQYSSELYLGYRDIERIEIAPFSLSTEAYAPLIGVHARKKYPSGLGIEVFLAGGPLSVEIRYEQSQSYAWFYSEGGNENLVFQQQSRRVEHGDGTGLTLEAGGRLNLDISRRWGLFVEAGYVHQVISNISGSGTETFDGETRSWQGEWRVRQVHHETPWGERTLEYPTSFPGDGPDSGASRDFELDLSGFQLRFGVAFRF